MDMDMRTEDTRNYTKLDTRTEMAMMTGDVMLLAKQDELEHALGYVASAIGVEKTGKEICQEALRYSDTEKTGIIGFSTGRVFDDPVINIILRDKDEDFDLGSEDGVLCYVLNANEPMFSELGYCFFESRNGNPNGPYHRIA